MRIYLLYKKKKKREIKEINKLINIFSFNIINKEKKY